MVVKQPGVTQIVSHCEKVICIAVPSEGNQLVTPNILASAWWPDDLALPEGSPMERLMFVWVAISERVSHVRDPDRGISSDCWLTPSSTWSQREGDCEDHAILMVAMLAKLDVRAWLTWGKLNGEGHAWVEVEIEDKLFLVEATEKSPLPANLPLGNDPDHVFEIYSGHYVPGLFEPIDVTPSRTDGRTYGIWIDGAWTTAELSEPRLIIEGQ